MGNTASATKVSHNSSIRFCLHWMGYIVFGDYKEKENELTNLDRNYTENYIYKLYRKLVHLYCLDISAFLTICN